MSKNNSEDPRYSPAAFEYYRSQNKSTWEYLVKSVIGISMGAIAAFFFAFTRKIEPPLTLVDEILALTSFVSFIGSVSAGYLFVWLHLRNYQWHARAIRNPAKRGGESFDEKVRRVKTTRKRLVRIWAFFFTLALLTAFGFVFSRVIS